MNHCVRTIAFAGPPTTSPLFTTLAAAAAHLSAPDLNIPKMVSAVEAPDRGLFTSALMPALSLSLPPLSLHRVRTRLFLLCFVSKMQTPTSTAPKLGLVERGRVFVPLHYFYACFF